MVSFLVSYVCTTALMTDCVSWSDQSWRGALAPVTCDVAQPVELAKLKSEYPTLFSRVECETQKEGE